VFQPASWLLFVLLKHCLKISIIPKRLEILIFNKLLCRLSATLNHVLSIQYKGNASKKPLLNYDVLQDSTPYPVYEVMPSFKNQVHHHRILILTDQLIDEVSHGYALYTYQSD